jgi:hypothetical protein
MDPGFRSPLLDFFLRGEVARDVRLMAAHGALAPRALEQVALLLILQDDAESEIAAAARETLDRLPRAALQGFLARPDVPAEMRAFFDARGIVPATEATSEDSPLLDRGSEQDEDQGVDGVTPEEGAAPSGSEANRLASLSVMEKVKVAMRGSREARSVLIRDPNRLVGAAVLSSPKLTEAEVERFAKMANVSDEVLRVIGTNRTWTKNYGVLAGLVRNPKTPVAIALRLLNRVNDRDVKMLAIDRNIPEPVRLAARNRTAAGRR